MHTKFSPSINIIRDENRELKYIVTPNALKVANQIGDLFKKGLRSFNIIGSYGTGKSSFLWALEKTILGEGNYFENDFSSFEKVEFLKIVGQPESLRDQLGIELGLPVKKRSSSAILSSLSELFTSNRLTVLVIDEFGKFLEYAVNNDTDSEIYFLQQLAELMNTPEHNCLLLTTLHQSFDAYGHHELQQSEKQEWRKVKGRFKDLTFNEPIEQLLLLAANNLNDGKSSFQNDAKHIVELQRRFHIVKVDSKLVDDIARKLWPLDILSAYLLCVALQRYGQNERSLFTFLESEFSTDNPSQLGIPEVYDYLLHEFYSYLSSKFNVDYTGWSLIDYALDRIETDFTKNKEIAEDLVKVVGLVALFGHKGAHVESEFLTEYLSYNYEKTTVQETLGELEKIKLIRFNRFSKSYKIFEGTDLDFEHEFLRVSREIDTKLDIIDKLKEYFKFPVINAKSVSYLRGTPRLFQYVISELPIHDDPEGQIDGWINLVFGGSSDELRGSSVQANHIVYAHFQKSQKIRETIFEIEKTQRVLAQNKSDRVAERELTTILSSQKSILNHQVVDALFKKDVTWYYDGAEISISSNKELNQVLSSICKNAYSYCPTFRNELINRTFLSGNIANSKKILFEALVSKSHLEDLGFSKDHFPAEKTIYLTLLKQNEIHKEVNGNYTFGVPNRNGFDKLWESCDNFLESAKSEKKKVSELFEILGRKPYRMTSGFLEFWVPIYLFIKRDEYALFSKDEGYLPEITGSILYLFTRSANDYEIKSFDVQGVKLDLYNKYREFLTLKDVKKVNNQSLIESIKPFLIFHKDLNVYAKSTNRLSKETIAFRETIATVQDPEKLFFELFPKALNTEVSDLLKSEELFEGYVNRLRISIKELRGCYDELVNRIEAFLLEEILLEKELSFKDYKEKLSTRYSFLKEHMLLRNQASFLMRINSPIDDRNSWINSICQVVIGKRLEVLEDKEEEVLKEKLLTSFKELDNLVTIAGRHETHIDQQVLKLELTSFEQGLIEETIMIPKEVHENTQKKLDEMMKSMGENKKINLYLLVSLLKEQLNE